MEKNIRNLRIGDILKEYGYVTEEQIDAALACIGCADRGGHRISEGA